LSDITRLGDLAGVSTHGSLHSGKIFVDAISCCDIMLEI